MLSKRPRKTTLFIQELVQNLQGAFDSSRCVRVVSALCRIRERCCGINVAAAAPFLFCAGTWERRGGKCIFILLGVEGGGVVAVWWGSVMNFRFFMMNFRFLFTSNFFQKQNKSLFFFFSYCLFITSLSSLDFPGKNTAWSLLFT